MSENNEIPAYLQAMISKGEVQDSTEGMKVDTGGVPRVSTKGKTFRFKSGDDEVKYGQSIDVIIVGMSPERGLAHTYYKDGYTPDASAPPDCSSYNGHTPDGWISEPQNGSCAKCPMAVWGSAVSMSGGKAKACKDSKHLYIAREEDFSKDPKNATLFILSVTVNSLKSFTNYGKDIAKASLPGPQFVITRITFDDEASVPKLQFENIGILNEDLGPVSYVRSQEKEWDSSSKLPPPQESNRALPEAIQEDANVDAVTGDSNGDLLDKW